MGLFYLKGSANELMFLVISSGDSSGTSVIRLPEDCFDKRRRALYAVLLLSFFTFAADTMLYVRGLASGLLCGDISALCDILSGEPRGPLLPDPPIE